MHIFNIDNSRNIARQKSMALFTGLFFNILETNNSMAQITLSNYVGFIFSEIVKARSIADAESKRMALLYREDEILKHFSVPRFKIPEMELTIPVLVSGAKYRSIVEFTMEFQPFNDFVWNKLKTVIRTVMLKQRMSLFTPIKEGIGGAAVIGGTKDVVLNPLIVNPIMRSPVGVTTLKRGAARRTAAAGDAANMTIDELIKEFFEELKSNPDPSNPENIVSVRWAHLFEQILREQNLYDTYKKLYPNNDLYTQTNKEVLGFIENSTIVTRTDIENILVNPETQLVKDGSNDVSVFMVKAKIMEDGVYIKEIQGSDGKAEKIVEFD